MNVQALRFWGIVVGSALIAFALWIAALGPAPAPSRASPAPVAHLVQAPAATPSSFLVRFRGGGPIARALAEAARGRTLQARSRIEAQLRRQSAFAGLCFDRFTAGAAEVVLRSCVPAGANERVALEAQWLGRLRAMRAVAYADVNATATQQQRTPG
jgi:hypothetical protein